MVSTPKEGAPGTNLDPLHCIAAAQHWMDVADAAPTDAEALRIAKGIELLNGSPKSIRDLV